MKNPNEIEFSVRSEEINCAQDTLTKLTKQKQREDVCSAFRAC